MLSTGKLSTVQLRRLLFGFSPDNLMNLGLGAAVSGLQLPIKLAATVPYFRAGAVAMDSIPFVDMTATGFSLTKDVVIGLDAVVRVHDSENLAKMLKDYITAFATGKRFPGT